MICLSCTEDTVKKDLEIINENIDYIDSAEIRVDFLKSEEFNLLKILPEKAGIPCILTYRKPEDGGASVSENPGIDTETRCEILSAALDGDWAYIDLEEDADAGCERQLIKKLKLKESG